MSSRRYSFASEKKVRKVSWLKEVKFLSYTRFCSFTEDSLEKPYEEMSGIKVINSLNDYGSCFWKLRPSSDLPWLH